MVVVEGKHDEKEDKDGFIARSFTRKYILPKEIDPATVSSSLNSNGVLTIEASKNIVKGTKERTIPIELTRHR
ncbi:unnamed protein product [Soboliphyme baturini]|uniref:SHSP domain-containing protein n=1 Tax=Soboliphyme baturini TaxID=241478 RepID=A0A183J1N1_9BILA|nr:unnamed protein product [Soboliphyme baturini]